MNISFNNRIFSNPLFWLFFILIIATLFRVYNLPVTPPGLYPDEAMNGNNAVEVLYGGEQYGGFKVFYPENNGREGLFINIQALFIWFFGAHAWALRLVSALFGIGTVAGVYFLVKEFLSSRKRAAFIALIPTFLLAVSFWHINFSRIGFRAIMAPFFLVWGIYLLCYGLRVLREHSKTWIGWSLIGGAGFVYGLGMHSYISYRLTPLLIVLVFVFCFVLYRPRIRQITLAFTVFVAASLVAFAPLGLYFLENPQDFVGRSAQVSVFSSPTALEDVAVHTLQTLGMFNVIGDYNWRHNYSGRPQLHWLVGLFFLLGIVWECVAVGKRIKRFSGDDKGALFLLGVLLSWFGLGLVPAIISSEGIPHALRTILVIPPVFVFAGLGVWRAFQFCAKYVSAKSLTAALCVIGIMLVVNVYYTYLVSWANNPDVANAFSQPYADLGKAIRDLPTELPKVVVVNNSGVLARGIPVSAQTTMFFSDTFVLEHRNTHNVMYITPDQEYLIPENAVVFYLER